ncbi:hypothetical protein L1987_81097 [Smallanthus sonchifolius]|uniref:Uncharacterized protein n=1 Tax=Smallanthus sonchifolius TaxID=185202 RepID=A0ACB8YQL8_9ASTR|nr:hypothetical protein L1987_81097 [Smallanthus sonchifolius]
MEICWVHIWRGVLWCVLTLSKVQRAKRWLGEAPRLELREDGRISGACFDTTRGITTGLKALLASTIKFVEVCTFCMEKVNEDGCLDFKWLKKRGVGGKNKEIRFYESFIYDGVEYKLYDCVYMYKEGLPQPYIGMITKLWERPDKSKKVKVHWFFLPEEISKWLGETKTIEKEIFLASGAGHGLANINPLEAIAGPCNVVCVSKDNRNLQPSDEELKAADFIFYRTFDVQSCTILDKMDDEVGGLEIKYIFNRKEGEKVIPSPGTSDTKEETPNTTISSETQKISSKTVPNMLKEDAKRGLPDNDIPNLEGNTESDKSHDQPLKKMKSDDKCVESGVACGSEKLTDLPSMKSKVDKDMMEVSIVPVEKVENKERNKTPTGSDKLHDQHLKKIKSDNKKPPEEKPVQLKVAQDTEKLTVDGKSKQADKLPADVNNLKTSGTPGTTEDQKTGKISGTVADDLEGKKLKRTRDDGSFKVPDNKKAWVYMNGKDLAANSASSKEKSKSGTLDSMEAKEEQSGEKKINLSMNKSLKVPALSTDKDQKNVYGEFVVTRRPNAEKSTWFKRSPWEERLKNAYGVGTAILLHNLKPEYTSEDVEDIIWHAFNENCDAKILQRTAVSSPHYVQALVILKTKEAAEKILTKLDEECLMLSDERPLVGTPCPPVSTKKNFTFFGHLTVDKARFQNQREDEAVSTSHFSQPNTIEYDMAMEWCLQQIRSKKCWEKLHKQQGLELKKLKKDLKQKPA